MKQSKEDILKEFDKKFVIKAGTKKIKVVGFWATKHSELPSCFEAEDLKSFLSQALDQYGKKEEVGDLDKKFDDKFHWRIVQENGLCACEDIKSFIRNLLKQTKEGKEK